MLTRSRLEQLLWAFDERRVIVLGDLMLDEFIWGKVHRISPEAPVPVIQVTSQTYRLGGAANVAANIRALGGIPAPIGVVGRDREGRRLIALTEEAGIDPSGLVVEDRPTTLKTRIIAHNQQVARTDRELRDALNSDTNKALTFAFGKASVAATMLIISDYDKGVVNQTVLAQALPKARELRMPAFVDPRVHHADHYHPIDVITPNSKEAELLSGVTISDDQALERAGRRLVERFGCEHALITRGEEGMWLFSRTGSRHLPTLAREVFDVTGAGDTVIAALGLAVSAGATMEEAAIIANHAAGIAVAKIGTATVSREELLADFDMHHAGAAG